MSAAASVPAPPSSSASAAAAAAPAPAPAPPPPRAPAPAPAAGAKVPYRSLPLAVRKEEAAKLRVKFPGRVPVIVERAQWPAGGIPELDKSRYIVPGALSMGQFMYVLRGRLKLPPETAMFLFIEGGILATTSALMSELAAAHASADGFLYLTYTGESAFGAP